MGLRINVASTTADFRREEAKRLFNRIVNWVMSQQSVVGRTIIKDLVHHVVTADAPFGTLPFSPVISKKEIPVHYPGLLEYEIGKAISPHLPFEGRIRKVTKVVMAFGYAIGTVTYSLDRSIGTKPVTKKLIWKCDLPPHYLMTFWKEGGPGTIKIKPITGSDRRLIRGKEIARYRGLVLNAVWWNVRVIDAAIRTLKESSHEEDLQRRACHRPEARVSTTGAVPHPCL